MKGTITVPPESQERFRCFNPRTHEGYDHCIAHLVLIPSRYLAKADCRAKPGGAYFLSVGDTVFSPPTTDARLTIQFIPLPTFHLDGRRILVFLIKLPSFLKQIFHIYHFLEEKHFYKKNLVVKSAKFAYADSLGL